MIYQRKKNKRQKAGVGKENGKIAGTFSCRALVKGKAKKGPTGGGRGAREAKTKGKDKKRKKKEEEEKEEQSGGALTEDEINTVLEEDELFSMLDEEARQALGKFY